MSGIPFRTDDSPGHQNAAPGGATADQQPPHSSQPVPPGDPLDDSPQPNYPIRDIVLTERDKQLLAELRRAFGDGTPAMCGLSIRLDLEGAKSGHQSWALLCRYRCRLLLAGIPKGVDRNSELKLRLHLWETGQLSDLISKLLGQQNSGPLRRTARPVQLQTDEQRGKRACALTARGSSSKATKGLVCGAAEGSADCRRNWTTALIPRSSSTGTHPTSAEGAEAARNAWGAVVSFAGAGQRRRLFRELDILTIKWVTGDLPEECRFLLNTQLMFFEERE